MRKLIIRRNKSIVGCLGTMKVYIEDSAAAELELNGVPCRKLGELKNGQEQTFEIGKNPAKVFVIADKISKGFCCDYVSIPGGSANVTLSGKNHFNPGAGNPFYFDGVTDEAVLNNRKKGTKRGIVVMAAAILVGFLLGFAITSILFAGGDPMDFTVGDMHLTLTDEFERLELDGLTAYYESGEVSVFILQELFTDLPDVEDITKYTLEDYGRAVLKNNEFTASVRLQHNDGLLFFEFQDTSSVSGEYYDYFAAIYRDDDSFWLVQFATHEDLYDEYRTTFMEWAKQIYFEAD